MASVITCDGCSATQQDGQEFHRRGYVRPVDYCPNCISSYDDLVRARDELHTKLATEWKVKLRDLEAKWRENHPDGRLPDR